MISQSVRRCFIDVRAVLQEQRGHFNRQLTFFAAVRRIERRRQETQRSLKSEQIRLIRMSVIVEEESNGGQRGILNGEEKGGVALFVQCLREKGSISVNDTGDLFDLIVDDSFPERRAIDFQQIPKEKLPHLSCRARLIAINVNDKRAVQQTK